MSWGLNALGWFFIGYSVLINSSFLVLTFLAFVDFWSYLRRTDFAAYDETFAEPLTPGISILMPAYNESAGIVESVQAMTALRYPDFEVVVIDDGSKDDTSERLIEAFDMVEVPIVVPHDIETVGEVVATYLSRRGAYNVLLVRKTNGGKADALNVGINAARKPLVCMVDADSLLDPDALLHVSRPFADDPDRVVASGGVVRVANGSDISRGRVTRVRMPGEWLPRIQVVEYLRAFFVGRTGWSRIGGLLIISGAFGVFRRDVLLELGGLATDCIGEDAELVVRLHRWLGDHDVDGRVVFVAEPVAWTEVPVDRGVLRKQRRRWHRGLTEILSRHKRMVFRPRYGVVGLVSMPWFVAFELFAPFIEIFGVVFLAVAVVLMSLDRFGLTDLQLVNPDVVWVLLATALLYAIVVTLASLVLEELSFRRYRGLRDLLVQVLAAIGENVGYRQLNAWWRLTGSLEAWRGTKHEWGDMQRRGLGKT
ncbi:MAG: glycosyltransferase family 2 protein [Nocardioidaceae bacterium]|nr:glycosyltransferase family 2 protein [Nocardioidaceae bacterium]NUS52584.1 glycosyltransferase family 2 protein [Nocardioidaceae bacterium]